MPARNSAPAPSNTGTLPAYGTVQDAADILACSPKTIRRMIAAGDIEAVRVNRQLLRVNLATLTANLERVGGVR